MTMTLWIINGILFGFVIALAILLTIARRRTDRGQKSQLALSLYGKLSRLGKNNEWVYPYARALRNAGLTQQALIKYRRSLELYPDHPPVYFELAKILEETGEE